MKRRDLITRIATIAKDKGLNPEYIEGGSHTKVQIGTATSVIPCHLETHRPSSSSRPHGGVMTSSQLTAKCVRSGRWWAVDVEQIKGLHTQAKRLDQVDHMVRDAASMLTGKPAESFQVDVVAQLEPEYSSVVEEALSRRLELAAAERAAALASRQAVSQLRNEGLAVRDIATIMKVSPQRITQLLASLT